MQGHLGSHSFNQSYPLYSNLSHLLDRKGLSNRFFIPLTGMDVVDRDRETIWGIKLMVELRNVWYRKGFKLNHSYSIPMDSTKYYKITLFLLNI